MTPTPWFTDEGAMPYNPKANVPAFSDCGASIWANNPENKDYPIEIVIGGAQDEQGGAVGFLNNDDARFAVRAVNSHAALVEALETMLARERRSYDRTPKAQAYFKENHAKEIAALAKAKEDTT